MEWTWDEGKAEVNYAKHRVRFAVAAVALDDFDAYWEEDWHPDGDRLRTVAKIGKVMLLIVHTDPEEATGAPGRIISARRAEPVERRAYE